MRRAAGFTLIELMVTIGIAAILLALALPSFTESIRSNRVSTATNQMLATFNLARAEALRSKSRAWICPHAGGNACGTNWNQGLLIWTDENGNGSHQDLTETKRVIEQQEGITLAIDPTIAAIGFDDRGRAVEKTGNSVTVRTFNLSLKATTCKPGAYNVRAFEINRIGRVSVTKGTCS
nr:GspH/FimT family pseudopilin [Lysobacter sp. BMK333-48F3]